MVSVLGAAVLFADHALAQNQGPSKPPAAQQGQRPPINPSEPPPPPSEQPKPAPAPGGTGSIRRLVDLVVLRATVLDQRGEFVNDLPAEAFHVYEDRVEQKLSIAKQEDVPVSMGLVIDNSGSMREKRPLVNAAALTLVETSNPQDEAFVVNFNDDYYVDTDHDFTSDINEMKQALERIDARGSTALYDAVLGSLDWLKKGQRDKKVLLVVTDGEDNMSRHKLAEVVENAEHSNTVIYAVGLLADKDTRRSERNRAKRALQEMSEATGGVAFFPEEVADTESICKQIAHDIRNQYTLAYYPTNDKRDGTFRTVRVEVTPHGRGHLSVRTRNGYYAKSSTSTSD